MSVTLPAHLVHAAEIAIDDTEAFAASRNWQPSPNEYARAATVAVLRFLEVRPALHHRSELQWLADKIEQES